MSDSVMLAQRSASALGWSWAGALVRAALQLAVQIALARLLGPESFGQAAAVLLVVNLGWLVAEGGFGAALVQREQLDPLDIERALGGVLVLSAVVALAVVALARPLAHLFGNAELSPLVMACAAIIPLQALANLPLSLLQRRLDAKRQQTIQLSAYLLAYGAVGLAMAMASWGPWSVLAAAAMHSALTLLAGWLTVRHSLRPRWPQGGAVGGYALRTTAANLVNWALESVDRLLIGRLWGSASLGMYAVASNLVRAPVSLIMGAAQPVAFASASRLQDSRARVSRGYLAALSIALTVSTPVFVFLAWHSHALIGLLYGQSWVGATSLFAVLCLGMPAFVMLALTGAMLRGLDAVGSESRTQVWLLGLMAGGLWVAAERPVVLASAVVTAITVLRAAALYWVLARRIDLDMTAWLRAARAGLIFASVVVAISALFRFAQPLHAAAWSAVSSVLLCVGMLRVSRGRLLGEELIQVLRGQIPGSPALGKLCAWAGVRQAVSV